MYTYTPHIHTRTAPVRVRVSPRSQSLSPANYAAVHRWQSSSKAIRRDDAFSRRRRRCPSRRSLSLAASAERDRDSIQGGGGDTPADEPQWGRSLAAVREVWAACSGVPLKEDPAPAAQSLLRAIQLARGEGPPAGAALEAPPLTGSEGGGEGGGEAGPRTREEAQAALPGLYMAYFQHRTKAITSMAAFKEAAPVMGAGVNTVVVAAVLRVAGPRLLAATTAGDFTQLADMFGLPEKAVLADYIDQLSAYPLEARFLLFLSILVAEKVTMTAEFLPISFILPFAAPVVFGGILPGFLMSALASTAASSVNFGLGKTVLREKIVGFKLGEEAAPVGEAPWFRKVSRRFDSKQFPGAWPPEGFKTALVLRLCPILPIPIDAHWYIAGTTPLTFAEFFTAHFLGIAKTALLDAYLGWTFMTAALDPEALQGGARTVVAVESVVLIAVSLFVTNQATTIVTQLLTDEDPLPEAD